MKFFKLKEESIVFPLKIIFDGRSSTLMQQKSKNIFFHINLHPKSFPIPPSRVVYLQMIAFTYYEI